MPYAATCLKGDRLFHVLCTRLGVSPTLAAMSHGSKPCPRLVCSGPLADGPAPAGVALSTARPALAADRAEA